MISSELKDVLLTTRFCKYLDLHELDFLLKNNALVEFLPGEIILQQGKNSPGLYIILEGKVLVTAKVLGQGTANLSTLIQSNILGEMSIIKDGLCTTSAIACDTVKCLHISYHYFEMLSIFFPETKFKFIKAISEEVCNHLLALHNKITKFMMQSDMISHTAFYEIIRTLTLPTDISLDEIANDLQQLKNSEIFEIFDNEEFNELMTYVTPIKAPTRCTLIREYEKPIAPCFIVLRGAVQSSIVSNNVFAKLYVSAPMQLFCSISIVDCTELSIINFTTCERAILLKITHGNFEKLKKSNSQLWYKFYNLVCQSFIELERSADKLDIRLNSEIYNR